MVETVTMVMTAQMVKMEQTGTMRTKQIVLMEQSEKTGKTTLMERMEKMEATGRMVKVKATERR